MVIFFRIQGTSFGAVLFVHLILVSIPVNEKWYEYEGWLCDVSGYFVVFVKCGYFTGVGSYLQSVLSKKF